MFYLKTIFTHNFLPTFYKGKRGGGNSIFIFLFFHLFQFFFVFPTKWTELSLKSQAGLSLIQSLQKYIGEREERE